MYRNIMVPLDGSPLAECVLPHVESIAAGCHPTHVTLIRVVDLPHIPVVSESYPPKTQLKLEKAREAMELQEKNEAAEYLASIVQRLKIDPTPRTVVTVGQATDCLLGYHSQADVDLIIMATHGRSGVTRWIWGNVADRVLRGSHVPVLLIRPPGCVPGIK